MLMWALIIATLILCVVSSFPTKWCQQGWGWMAGLWHGHVARRLGRELARRTRGTRFAAAQSFLPRGVGLALDTERRQMFLAERDGGGLTSAVVDFASVSAVRKGEAYDAGFFDHYVELTVGDGQKPSWRLLCGANAGLAAEVEQALVSVRRALAVGI